MYDRLLSDGQENKSCIVKDMKVISSEGITQHRMVIGNHRRRT